MLKFLYILFYLAQQVNLYGHTHQKEHFYKEHPYMYCVCLDAHEMKPVLLDDIIEEVKDKRIAYEENIL